MFAVASFGAGPTVGIVLASVAVICACLLVVYITRQVHLRQPVLIPDPYIACQITVISCNSPPFPSHTSVDVDILSPSIFRCRASFLGNVNIFTATHVANYPYVACLSFYIASSAKAHHHCPHFLFYVSLSIIIPVRDKMLESLMSVCGDNEYVPVDLPAS